MAKEDKKKETKDKVACQYCGKEYSPRGIANHEVACPENPKNKELVERPTEPKAVVDIGSMTVKHN